MASDIASRVKFQVSSSTQRVKGVDFHPTKPWLLTALFSGELIIFDYSRTIDGAAATAAGPAPLQVVRKIVAKLGIPCRSAKFIARKNWIVAGSDDGYLRVFDAGTGSRVHEARAHSNYIRCVEVHPTLPVVLTACDDNTVCQWNWERAWQCTQTHVGHGHYVMQVRVCPARPNVFATASLDKTVRLWTMDSPHPTHVLSGHTQGVNCVAWGPPPPPTGATAASASVGGGAQTLFSGSDDSTVLAWDAATGARLATLDGHTNNVAAVDCGLPGTASADLLFSADEDKVVLVRDRAAATGSATGSAGGSSGGSGVPAKVVGPSLGRAWAVAVGPTGDLLAAGFDDGVTLYTVAGAGGVVAAAAGGVGGAAATPLSASLAYPLPPLSPASVAAAAAAPGGGVAVGGAGTSSSAVSPAAGTGGTCSCCSAGCPGSGGRAGGGGVVRTAVLAWAQGQGEAALQAHYDELSRVYDSLLTPASKLHTLRTELETLYTMLDWDATQAAARMEALIRTGSAATADAKKKEREFADLYEPLRKFRQDLSTALGHGGAPTTIIVNNPTVFQVPADGGTGVAAVAAATAAAAGSTLQPTTVVVGGGGVGPATTTVNFGGAAAAAAPFIGRQRSRFATGHTSTVYAVLPLPGNMMATGSSDNKIHIISLDSMQVVKRLAGHTRAVRGLCLLPDGNTLISGGEDNHVRVWDIATATCQATLEGATGWVRDVCVLADGRVAAASDDHTVRIWNIGTRTCDTVLRGPTRGLWAVVQLPDGSIAAASNSSENKVFVWDLATGAVRWELAGHSNTVRDLAVLPDGNLVSSSDDGSVRIWDVATGTQLRDMRGHRSYVRGVGVLAGGLIASIGDDRTCMIWDPATGTRLHSLVSESDVWPCVALPDGGFAAGASGSVGGEYHVVIWE